MNIKESDLQILLDRCKATVSIAGLQRIGVFLYTEEQFLDALNRVLQALGEREIEIKK